MAKAMKSMALSDTEIADIPMPMPGMDKPRFPYALRIALEDPQLAMLGMSAGELPKDAIICFRAVARVTSNSSRDDEGGKSARVELQIESMCCVDDEPDAEEVAEEKDDGEPMSVRRKKMYDRTE